MSEPPSTPGAGLDIVVPCFNEERVVARCVAALAGAFEAARVIVSDDGSEDGTVRAVRRVESERLTLVESPHRGKGHAIRRGVSRASADVTLVVDADLSVGTEYLSRLVGAVRDGAEVAMAARFAAGSRRVNESAGRLLRSRAFNAAVRLLTGLPYADTQCGFKAYGAEAREAIFPTLRVDGFAHDVEVLLLARRAGLKVAEVPVTCVYERGGARLDLPAAAALADVARLALWK